ncbi:CAP domain-containing protein [Micromonospora sp. CPCC 206061]|uniref:CAP domain-containing protein n=1 Tax=Micromonospora sp. CPCC 206061 TaxID=3122410 RepID=UPI002FF098DA
MFESAAVGVIASPVLGFAVPASAESEVVRLTNDTRADHGCPAVREDSRLRTAARRHSADMAANDFFSHTGSDGSDFSTRAKRAGYDHAMSENIAKGHPTAADVVKGWLGSAPRRSAILDCTAKAVGIGVAKAHDGALLWTQDFGRV